MKFDGKIKDVKENLKKQTIVMTFEIDATEDNHTNAQYLASTYVGTDSSSMQLDINPKQPPLTNG
jgi:hypothetical protein